MQFLHTTPPPTAGLPLQLADLWPWGSADLAAGLAQFLGLPAVQLECSGTSALMVALRTLKQAPHAPPLRGSLPLQEGPSAALGRPGGSGMAPHAPPLRGSLPLQEGPSAALGRPGGSGAVPHACSADAVAAPARNEVIVPAYTCPLVALAIVQCGLQLRLCDLRADSLDMDPVALQALCSEKTLAILPTHLCGRVTDMATALACARSVGAWVIEDAAQALGAWVNGTAVGLQGDIGFYSLAVGKGLTTFEGGVLVSRDAKLRAALAATSAACVPRSRCWELRRSLELLGYAVLYRPAGLGLAYGAPLRRALARGDWVEAAGDDFDCEIPQHRLGAWRRRVGLRALKRLPAFQTALAQQAEQRCARLAEIPGVEIVADSPAVAGAEGVWPVLLLRLASANARDAFMRAHWGAGWGLSLPFVHVLPDYGRYDAALGWAKNDGCDQARDWAGRLLAISNSPWLEDAQFAQIVAALEQCAQAEN